MNVRGIDALTGGVGSVAVALAHKRQDVARALIALYLDYYRTRGAACRRAASVSPGFLSQTRLWVRNAYA